MTTHRLLLDIRFDCPPDTTDDAFDEFTTRVMDELCKLEDVDSGIIDPDITASLADRTLSVYMGVDADSLRDALRLCSANVRTALHAAGCGTPGWPEAPELPTPRELEYT